MFRFLSFRFDVSVAVLSRSWYEQGTNRAHECFWEKQNRMDGSAVPTDAKPFDVVACASRGAVNKSLLLSTLACMSTVTKSKNFVNLRMAGWNNRLEDAS
jgi:hypothetical protein